MPRASHIFRRLLQITLVGMTALCLWMHFASFDRSRTGLTMAAVFATLFVASVSAEAYSRWWERKHQALSPEDLAALRNRTALFALCAVVSAVLLVIFVSAKGIPLQFLPILAGVLALFQFARNVGKK